MRMGLGVVLALALSGCVERKPATVAFSVEEAAFIKKTGTTTITGHAFRTKPSAVVVNAAGQLVRLVPATAYARERFANFYGTRKFVPHRDYPRDDNPDPPMANTAAPPRRNRTGASSSRRWRRAITS
jgi:hypothetical protein